MPFFFSYVGVKCTSSAVFDEGKKKYLMEPTYFHSKAIQLIFYDYN